jgi:YVTN family beta-propeller protein
MLRGSIVTGFALTLFGGLVAGGAWASGFVAGPVRHAVAARRNPVQPPRPSSIRVAVVRRTPVVVAQARDEPARPSSTRHLTYLTSVTGPISPKSVVASQTGTFVAQNMMYQHTVTVYDRRFRLLKTIPDAVRLADFGYPQYGGTTRGAPVEAAFNSGATQVYVSNYSMYGSHFRREGHDECAPANGYDRSFVYRIGLDQLAINQVIQVGSVPKFVAVTPDDHYVLVSNWCSYTLSVIDVATGKVIQSLYLGPYPRGIVVDPQSRFAYVAVMGSYNIARIDLQDFAITWIRGVGRAPRHLVIDPDGTFLYATLNGEGAVAKIDLAGDAVVTKVHTGSQPRSMAISTDGTALYVVNYDSNTVSKIDTESMRILQTVHTNQNPIGITYDDATSELWVACYSGSIMVFKDVLPR